MAKHPSNTPFDTIIHFNFLNEMQSMKSSTDPLLSPQPTNNSTIAATAAATTASASPQPKQSVSQAIRSRRMSVLMSPPKATPDRRTLTPVSSNSADNAAYAQLCDVCQVAGTTQDLVK